MRNSRPALSATYVHPGNHRTGGPVSRQVIAIAALVVAVLFGGKALEVLGTDARILSAVGSALVAVGGIAGGLYHPVGRFWRRGAFAGIVTAIGSFLTCRGYGQLRPDPWGLEFAVVAITGAIPGIVVYWLLMKDQVVEEGDA